MAKEEDWKKEYNELLKKRGNSPGLRGWVLLESGTRSSTNNPGSGDAASNAQYRVRQQKAKQTAVEKRIAEMRSKNPKTYKERLKGLFGGGEGPKIVKLIPKKRDD